MTRLAPVVLACAGLAACATNPKDTVLNLDTTDPKWASADCVAAREAAAGYKDRDGVRTAAAVAGMLSGVPAAGAIASMTIGAAEARARKDLNAKVQAACVSPKVTSEAPAG